MIRSRDFGRTSRPDYGSGKHMSRISVGYNAGISQLVDPDLSEAELESEYLQMIDSGLQHIYGDVRQQLNRLRAEVYQMSVEASATGVVSLHGIDRAFKEFETLLDG